MRTTAITIQIVSLLFLTLIPWPGPAVFKISCNRDDARIVRKVVHTKWLPLLDKYQVKLPLECPFHPLRDVFMPTHAAKLQHRASQWTCALCGKSFYRESHLEAHFERRHRDNVNKAEDAVCLADYCDIMRCQVLREQEASLGANGLTSTDVELWKDTEAAKHSVTPAGPTHLMPHPRPSSHSPHANKNIVPQKHCPKVQHTYDADDKDLDDEEVEEEDEDKGGDGETEEGNTTVEVSEDAVESALPPDRTQQRRAQIQALRASCDPASLQALKLRCEHLVHSCIATLLLHLTPQQFHELAEEMQRTVCWYLSCDRYWEEANHVARAFPWPLLAALATGLALALCMCYYIVWIVFDSEEGSVAGSASATMTAHSSPARGGEARGADDDSDQHDHYIYVTYPPDLKRRLLDSCYNRTTRL